MLVGMIVLSAVGIVCMAVGLALWKKQKIGLIHDYHTRKLRSEDVPAYTRLMGFGMLAIGGGCILTGVVALLLNEPLGWIALPIGLAAGFVLFHMAQTRYNGGYFSS